MYRVFVYGTLKRGHSANIMIVQNYGTFVKEARTAPNYALYCNGSFPGMKETDIEGEGVLGEVFEVPGEAFEVLDRYECVRDGLFRREEIELEDGSKAFAYLYNHPVAERELITNGVWHG